MNVVKLLPLAAALAITACSGSSDTVGHEVSMAPSDAFMAAVAAHCGKAFEGRIAVNEPRTDAPDPFEGKRLVMHVRGCEDPAHELRIPFHVGDDHSRTWVLSRTENGLRLKHDHRHEDGSPDAVTLYGGDSKPPGTAQRQSFPVDSDSVAMFRKADMLASVQNTWAMEVEPDQRFVYELTRPGGRHFQVVFDLSKPVALPPAPWGSEKTAAP
ncbi:hypothetical protein [Stenotrophomonas rhizophila]|uniref:hypothetical protein n=1 Tax=Stenotrophomonas rhizophila TaxID=216778 RepID=UPI003396A77E